MFYVPPADYGGTLRAEADHPHKGAVMKALVYQGPGKRAWEEAPDATIQQSTDAVVRVDLNECRISSNLSVSHLFGGRVSVSHLGVGRLRPPSRRHHQTSWPPRPTSSTRDG